MNDKIKKAKELLEGIKSVFQPVSGKVMVVVSRDEWDKIIQAESLLRSISPEAGNDKLEEVVRLLKYARNLPPNEAGLYEDNLQWGTDVDAILRSIPDDPQEASPSSSEATCEACEETSPIKEWPVAYFDHHNTIKCPKCDHIPGSMSFTEEPTPSPEAEKIVVHQCRICKREISIPHERVHNTMYAPSCCDWPMHKIHPQTEQPSPSPEAGTWVVCEKARTCSKECGAKTPHLPHHCEPCPFSKAACQPVEPDKPTVVLKPVNPKDHAPTEICTKICSNCGEPV